MEEGMHLIIITDSQSITQIFGPGLFQNSDFPYFSQIGTDMVYT